MTDIPATALRARQMYAENAPTREIMATTGLSHGTLYLWLDGGPKKNGRRPLPPVARRRTVVRRRVLKSERVTLVTRMMRAAEQQVSEIEERLALPQPDFSERERDARLMAVLVKTLRELTALDALNEDKKTEFAGDDDVPIDIDELRRELARRVDRIRQRRAAAGGVGGEPSP